MLCNPNRQCRHIRYINRTVRARNTGRYTVHGYPGRYVLAFDEFSFYSPYILVVGAATPSFSPWLFGIVCIVAGAIQILGLIGVARVKRILPYICRLCPKLSAQEKSTLFRRYITLHLMAIVAAFAIAAAWIIVSASRHSTAQTNCITNFYNATTTTVSSEGKTLCNIFPWVDVGIMGGLWAVLGLAHVSCLVAPIILNSVSYHSFTRSTSMWSSHLMGLASAVTMRNIMPLTIRPTTAYL